ncbi:CTB family bacteriocin [Dolichospermum circinale]|jgi:hypothetical protein|uniref:CTB family bacteriocin n=1 Tax=Dolichospermum circinale TaxID=109265 RepID=UPI00232F1A3A|nr:CTB family bacteriocin [Dolichospermum circinale]MDB9448388.1 CTB family bacteriocin [Dolichospermum circinale CS-547]
MSNLFTTVSVEQQEIVTGGLLSQALQSTGFAGLITQAITKGSSGPGGSTTETAGATDKRFTSGQSLIALDSPVAFALPPIVIPIL